MSQCPFDVKHHPFDVTKWRDIFQSCPVVTILCANICDTGIKNWNRPLCRETSPQRIHKVSTTFSRRWCISDHRFKLNWIFLVPGHVQGTQTNTKICPSVLRNFLNTCFKGTMRGLLTHSITNIQFRHQLLCKSPCIEKKRSWPWSLPLSVHGFACVLERPLDSNVRPTARNLGLCPPPPRWDPDWGAQARIGVSVVLHVLQRMQLSLSTPKISCYKIVLNLHCKDPCLYTSIGYLLRKKYVFTVFGHLANAAGWNLKKQFLNETLCVFHLQKLWIQTEENVGGLDAKWGTSRYSWPTTNW